MIIIRRYSVHNIKTGEVKFEVERSTQPVRNVLVYRLFHRIEPLLDRLTPLANRLIDKTRDRAEEPLLVLPFEARVDCLCYDLGQKNTRVLERIELNEHTWNSLSKAD